ncbi:Hint domain-containing protein [Thalassococcus sp. BH17M4-6]|uniref:Hint domain-containing protein n=1 Tax=Thalassococcus sp. BH17M4-6 TaxID=3413148 RepID=UPI003BCFA3FE
MPTAGLIYIGTFADADTNEFNYSNENDAVFAGTHDSSVLRPVTATFNTALLSNLVEDADILALASGFQYTLDGVSYNTVQDSSSLYSANILLGDGSTLVTDVIVIQMTNGQTFINEFSTPLDGLQIQSVTLGSASLSDNYDGWTLGPSVTGVQIVCFASGTRIATPGGPVPVEALRAGDAVTTLDHGAQPLIWVGRQRADGAGQAVRIAAQALGPDCPARALTVSRQHRVLLRSPIVQRMTGTPEVLVPAWTLAAFPGVQVLGPAAPVTWHHLMLPRHAILLAEGAPAESFFPGAQALSALPPAARRAIGLLAAGPGGYPLCRPELRGKRALQMVARHLRNRKPLVGPVPGALQDACPARAQGLKGRHEHLFHLARH